jgi:hypothetical protein
MMADKLGSKMVDLMALLKVVQMVVKMVEMKAV